MVILGIILVIVFAKEIVGALVVCGGLVLHLIAGIFAAIEKILS